MWGRYLCLQVFIGGLGTVHRYAFAFSFTAADLIPIYYGMDGVDVDRRSSEFDRVLWEVHAFFGVGRDFRRLGFFI